MNGKLFDYISYYYFTLKHKFYVVYYMTKICIKLIIRAVMHDMSKFSLTETNSFIPQIKNFRQCEYGSEEYKATMLKVKPALENHYKNNDHHPEHYKDFDDITFYALVELLCDWKSSVKKNKNGSLEKSLKINKERFNMQDNIIKLLKSI